LAEEYDFHKEEGEDLSEPVFEMWARNNDRIKSKVDGVLDMSNKLNHELTHLIDFILSENSINDIKKYTLALHRRFMEGEVI
jgi:hypothetical protein